jgi:hypothetical protein
VNREKRASKLTALQENRQYMQVVHSIVGRLQKMAPAHLQHLTTLLELALTMRDLY